MLKPVFHHADGPVSGLQDAYGLDHGVLFDTDEISPDEGDDHDPEELLDTLKMHPMRVLDVESACFHPAETVMRSSHKFFYDKYIIMQSSVA